MNRFAHRLWAVLACVIILSSCNVASAVEGVFQDNDYFGIRGSVANGVALIGQRFGGEDGNGDVQVFQVGETEWTLSANLGDLVSSELLSVGADFGAGALAFDKNTAIVGAYRNDVEGVSQAGSVFLFSKTGSTWTYEDQWTEMIPTDATEPVENGQFGIAGDLDGDHALIVSGGTNNAYIYERTEGSWDSGTLLEGGTINTPIASAIDQQVAVVGTFLNDGYVDVWRNDGETWSYEAQITNPSSDNLFATAVDISENTIVVSARNQTIVDTSEETISGAGAVYVFHYEEESSEWALQQTIEHPEPEAGDAFGYSVAIEGDKLVVGAPRQDGSGELIDVGAAYVFERTDSTWTQVEKKVLDVQVTGQWFGEIVSVDEWSTLIAGSGRTTEELLGQGVVQLDGSLSEDVPGDANRDGFVNDADAAILSDYWGESVSGWGQGDFNDDGVVNAVDAAIMAANWGYGETQAEGTAVPEPTSIALILGGLLGMAFFGRRAK